ncbi:MAG: DUF6129 family protein [Azovibrio sp.]|uniref:DUF6129 family protein n=1 Tax=Azovibrio sp. TaxID=1872673 RepID=UPI003C74779F
MMIAPETLKAVAAAAPGCDPFELRKKFPGVMFTVCGEDDIPARLKHALETPTHYLYYFTNASGHCLEFTSDPAAATGIVVAARADER